MDENLNGALLAVKSAFEAVIIAFGEVGTEGVSLVAKPVGEYLPRAGNGCPVPRVLVRFDDGGEVWLTPAETYITNEQALIAAIMWADRLGFDILIKQNPYEEG